MVVGGKTNLKKFLSILFCFFKLRNMQFKAGHQWWYGFYRVLAFFAMRLFYRRTYFKNIEGIPLGAGVILAPNHQSAFMDAFMVSVMTKAQNRYLVRADIFKKPIARKILTGMNMLPIYRLRDGIDSMERNEQIFRSSEDAVLRKEAMVIFPEGNQANQWKLRPLKKGYARIAVGALKRAEEPIDIYIVPTGINYYHFTSYRSQLVVEYGKPIRINEYKKELEENEAKTINELKSKLYGDMTQLLFHIKDNENYDAIKEASFLLSSPKDELSVDFERKKAFFHSINTSEDDKLLNHALDLNTILSEYDVKGEDLYHAKLGKINFLLFPFVYLFFFLAKVINAPVFIPLENFVKNKVKDIHFHASLRYAFCLLGYPIIILIVLSLLSLVFSWGVAISVVSGMAVVSYLGILSTDKLRYWKLRNEIGEKVGSFNAFITKIDDKVSAINNLID